MRRLKFAHKDVSDKRARKEISQEESWHLHSQVRRDFLTSLQDELPSNWREKYGSIERCLLDIRKEQRWKEVIIMIERKILESQQGEPAKEQDLIAVAPVALLVPEVAHEYGLPYEPEKPYYVLNPQDNGQACVVGGIVEAPKRGGFEGYVDGVPFQQISARDLDEGIGLSRCSDNYPNLGGWVAVLEPIGSQRDDFPSGVKVAERARVRAIRAFESSQYQAREIREGFVIAVYAKLYPISGLRSRLNPSYSFSIGENGQVSFSVR